jgi:hypothetical protein
MRPAMPRLRVTYYFLLFRSMPHTNIVFFLIKPVCICRQLYIDWLITDLKGRLGKKSEKSLVSDLMLLVRRCLVALCLA